MVADEVEVVIVTQVLVEATNGLSVMAGVPFHCTNLPYTHVVVAIVSIKLLFSLCDARSLPFFADFATYGYCPLITPV